MDLRWNTIESAPRGETWIILYTSKWERPSVGRWVPEFNKFYSQEYGFGTQPTMWCPLPHWEKQS